MYPMASYDRITCSPLGADTVKPFFLQYFTPDDTPRNNVIQDGVSVLISDIRSKENNFSFSKNGFAILDLQSSLTYEDFGGVTKIEEVYCEELSRCLLDYLGAESIQFFDQVVCLDLPWLLLETLNNGLPRFDGATKITLTSILKPQPHSSRRGKFILVRLLRHLLLARF